MEIPTLETTHLIPRPWSLEDSDELFRILQEPGILKYFPPTTFTLKKTHRYINHQLNHWQERGYGHWVITLKDGHAMVGWDGLEYLPETGENEVAYLLSHKVWGRSFATEAAQAAVRYGFDIARLQDIIGLVHPENIGSIRVLEKCGLSSVDRKVYWGVEMCRYCIKSEALVK
jgi:[ribosomal protein S5]-alanine N-acetyltransferase